MSHKSEILRSVIFFVFFTVITCPALTVPDAQIQGAASDPYHFNDVVKFVCNTGYQLVSGDLSRTCRSEGTWSGDPAVCKSRNQTRLHDKGLFTANESRREIEKKIKEQAKEIKEKFKHQRKSANIKEIFGFHFAFARCEWALTFKFFSNYNWQNYSCILQG